MAIQIGVGLNLDLDAGWEVLPYKLGSNSVGSDSLVQVQTDNLIVTVAIYLLGK